MRLLGWGGITACQPCLENKPPRTGAALPAGVTLGWGFRPPALSPCAAPAGLGRWGRLVSPAASAGSVSRGSVGIVTAADVAPHGELRAPARLVEQPWNGAGVWGRAGRVSTAGTSLPGALGDNLKYCNLLNSHMRKNKKKTFLN